MRKVLMTVGMVALLAAPVLAQFGGRGAGAGMLLSNKGVQEELKLTDKQKDAVAEIRKLGFRDREKIKEATDKVVEELNSDQKKRLKQLEVQLSGPQAFAREDVQSALKLTDKQKDEIKEITEDIRKDTTELRKGSFGKGADAEKRAEAQKKIATLNKEGMDKISKSLSDDQKKTWKELTGTPFEFKFDFGTRPGGGKGKGKGRNKDV